MADHRIDFELTKSYLKISGVWLFYVFIAMWTQFCARGIQLNCWPEVLNNLAYISIQIIQIITTWNVKYNTLSEAEISPKLVEHK